MINPFSSQRYKLASVSGLASVSKQHRKPFKSHVFLDPTAASVLTLDFISGLFLSTAPVTSATRQIEGYLLLTLEEEISKKEQIMSLSCLYSCFSTVVVFNSVGKDQRLRLN